MLRNKAYQGAPPYPLVFCIALTVSCFRPGTSRPVRVKAIHLDAKSADQINTYAIRPSGPGEIDN